VKFRKTFENEFGTGSCALASKCLAAIAGEEGAVGEARVMVLGSASVTSVKDRRHCSSRDAVSLPPLGIAFGSARKSSCVMC
jgi:hypothetical protein